ncbi:MAG TPA: hypothetical protein VGH44_01570 [Candidatus Saccharimonadia bacterium]|jgi:hypothetical protein
MNTNMKLELNAETLRALWPGLKKAQPYIYGVLLVGVFGYTAYVLNQAINVQPANTQTVIKSLPKVTFYQDAIDSLSKRTVVNGDVPLNLGNGNPF